MNLWGGTFGQAAVQRRRREIVADPPDFTLSSTSVVTQWGRVVVGELIPNAATPPGAYFVLVGEPASLAVENG